MKKLENLNECLKNLNLLFNVDLVYSKRCTKELNNQFIRKRNSKSDENFGIYNKFKN